MHDTLEAHLKPLAGPFLFVVAGLSRRHAGSLNWGGLHVTTATPDPYAELTGQKLRDAASLIAKDFHEVCWATNEYKVLSESRRRLGSGVPTANRTTTTVHDSTYR